MTAKTKLELNWIGKENRPRLEPRILIENEHYSHHASARRDGDNFDNVLIRGDNLLALRALESEYEGRVRCVFIDPPYNTGSAFEQYDDGLEHSVWLGMMRDRLEIIHRLLSDDGSLWMTIDDNEAHYLKVMCDEVFGRSNFVANVVWQKKFSPQNDARWISDSHDHILLYAKNKSIWVPNPLPRTAAMDERYKNPDNDPRGPWASTDLTRAEHRDRDYWGLETPSGNVVYPARGRSWSRPKENIEKLKTDGRLWFGPTGDRMPRLKKYLSEMEGGLTPQTVWLCSEVGHNQEAKREIIRLDAGTVFATPKPERLLHRILHIATNEGDIVLDSFAGSGTTGAVAHKMRRRWLMVELGDHCETIIVPRLNKVIDGEDDGGVTSSLGWQGGGGYRYYRLAPSMLEKDQFGRLVISKSYSGEMLSEAMCKHFGFSYSPSTEHYWMHGHSSEKDFIYVTTASLTHEQLRAISQEVGDERTLLIACKAFQTPDADGFPNLTLRKIPAAVLHRCEWGKDDYSLKIENLPMMEDVEEDEEDQSDLFTGEAAQ
jgi:adenine-specific DNA-methyltransferase